MMTVFIDWNILFVKFFNHFENIFINIPSLNNKCQILRATD